MEFWKKQELVFVETPAVIKVLQCLESEHTVLIVGEPGIGKSMLMHHVALKIHSTTSYCIVPCSGIQDIFNHYNMDKSQMFVIDDICGRFTPSLLDIEYLIKNEDKLKRMLGKGKTKIAATCRLDIYLEDAFCKSCTVFKPNIFNLSEEYSKEDKLKICMKYLSKTSCEFLENETVKFTPLMCYLYSKNEEFNLMDFLHCPYVTYQKEWEKLNAINPHKYCSLFLCVIHNGIIEESLFDILNDCNNKNEDILKNIFEICEVNRGTSRIKMKSTFDSMIGTYLVKTKTEYRVIHDQMFDFLCSYFGSKETLVRCILRYANIRVFNERTQLESINETPDKFTILISKKNEQEYFERIKNDLQLGRVNQCFCNSQMKYDKHRAKFLKVLQSIDDNFLFEQMFSRKYLQYTCNYKENIDVVPNKKYNEDSSDAYTDFDLSEPLITSCSRGYYEIVQFFITKYMDLKKYYSFNTPLTASCSGGHEKIVMLLVDKGCDINKVDAADQTPLTAACSGEHAKIVQLLLEKGCDSSHSSFMGDTPLIAACMTGNEKIVKLLIRGGCDVNQVNHNHRNTPLTAACRSGNEKIVQLLIRRGCDVHVNAREDTPLTAACWGGNDKIVQLLIDKGCDVTLAGVTGRTPLTAAGWGGNKKIVELLIENGCSINDQVNNTRYTPLVAACWGGDMTLVQLLIEKGCDINQFDGSGDTPLSAACRGGNEKMVQFLIEKGCDVIRTDVKIHLMAACWGGNEKIVQLLLEHGCDINQRNYFGYSPLVAACSGVNDKLVKFLIEKGCDINKADCTGDTPLAAACIRRNERFVQFLIDKGCDVTQADCKKKIHLIAACHGGNVKIVKLLFEKGCDVNQVDNTYMEKTPLTVACLYRKEKLVQLLIESGCDINQVDGIGDTPLEAACKGRNENIVQFLLDKGCDVEKKHLMAAYNGGNKKIVQLLKKRR